MYPLLKKHLANKVDQVLSYMLLYNETAIANLLEVRLGMHCKYSAAACAVHGPCEHMCQWTLVVGLWSISCSQDMRT